MKTINIYEYLDYLRFIHDFSESLPNKGRGFRKLMATKLDCQMSFITHVLNGEKDFSVEQLFKLCELFNLNKEERDYFINLHAYNRAGTSDLKKYYLSKLEEQKEQYYLLQQRLTESQVLSVVDQTIYYSDWLYSAVHMAATVPELQNITKLKEHFHLDSDSLMKVVDFLAKKGLIKFDGQTLTPGHTNIFIQKRSPILDQYHRSWRIKLMQNLKDQTASDVHYTLCFTAAEIDFPLIRQTVVKAIEECMKIIEPAKEEKIGVLCIDLREI